MSDIDNNQDQLNQHIKTLLDHSVDQLDADTRYQLQLKRAQVINNSTKSHFIQNWPVFGGIATFASIAALAGFLFIGQPQNATHEMALPQLDSVFLEIDTSIELYEQYDFYVWLSQQESQG